MTTRISILAIVLIGYLIFLLSNIEVTPVRFFIFQLKIPMFYIIAFCTAFGAGVAVLFFSMFRYARKIKIKLRNLQALNTSSKPASKSRKSKVA